MRVLVTGAGGLIGSAVVDHLLARGVQVTALSRAWRGPCPADRVWTGDACDQVLLDHALAGADAVAHLAAIPSEHLGTAYQVFRTNTSATFAVLERAAAHGVRRAVIASSINASGVPHNPRGAMPAYFPIDEDLPPDIADPYSLSKHVDEDIGAMAARAWDMTVIALRFPFVQTGAGLLHGREWAQARPEVLVREGFSYLHVDDAARAVHAALLADVGGPACHVVGLSATDTLLEQDSASLLTRWAPGVPVRREIPGRAALVDTGRAEHLLGFLPAHRIQEITP